MSGKGISAMLYYQQEEVPSGHDRTPAPIKQNARVLRKYCWVDRGYFGRERSPVNLITYLHITCSSWS
ncbi:asr2795 [Nostoc sp. PCC 7120 = FACHB-418]|nr:asr2795 [Nostoc sp. PCC 7120 = FACHB-418]